MEVIWKKILLYGLEAIGLHYSKYRAIVVDTEDPLKLNRLRLRVPHLNALADDDTWAWPTASWGGKDYGMQLLPNKGDMVWVEFQYGNPDYPIWSHASYAEGELPVEFKTTKHYGFKTPRGTLVLINDNKETEEVLIKLNNKEEWVKIIKEELEIEAKLIKLGKDGEEKAVMGETLLNKMEDIMDKLDETYQATITHIHPTNVGPSGPPTNATTFTQLRQSMTQIKNVLDEFLSNKVKIDK